VAAGVLLAGAALAACSGGGEDAAAGDPTPSSSSRPTPTTRASSGSTATRPAGAGYAVCYDAPRGGGGGAIALREATDDEGLVDPLLGLYGHAVAAGDVDGDGWTDLFVGNFGDRPEEVYQQRGARGPVPDQLLLGGPDGFRVDDTFPEMRGRTSGAAFADLDGDGDLDLAVARNVNGRGEIGRMPSVVLRNDDGRFTDAVELDDRRGARSIGVLDYDGDGALDLYLVEDRFTGGSSALYRNSGDLRFRDVTAQAGLPRDVAGLGVAATDLDGDGRPDLFVGGDDRMFVNSGDGRFREVDAHEFRWRTYGEEDDVAGVAAGDVNGDGRTDLVLGQHFNSTLDEGRRVPVRLYLNEGGEPGRPSFRDVTEAAGLVGLPTKAPHVELVDFDADGRLDLLTTASAGGGEQPAVFRNTGGDGDVPRFEAPAGLGSDTYWVTAATGDFDRDGRLDVFLVDWDPGRPSRLLTGAGDTGHWLAVEAGPGGSRAVGARVEVYRAGGLGDPAALLGQRDVVTGVGFGGGAVPEARFGLGEADRVDVRITLPAGTPVELTGVPVDRLVGVDGACGG
jgi:hypothetical protein